LIRQYQRGEFKNGSTSSPLRRLRICRVGGPCRFGCLCPFRGSGQKPLLVCSRVRMRLQIQIGKLFSEAKGNRRKKSITLQRGKPGNLAAFTALVVILLDMNSVQVSHVVLDRFSSVNAKCKQRRERDADVVCVSAKVTVSAVDGIYFQATSNVRDGILRKLLSTHRQLRFRSDVGL